MTSPRPDGMMSATEARDRQAATRTRDRLARVLASEHPLHFVMGDVHRCPYGPGMAVTLELDHGGQVCVVVYDGAVMVYADPKADRIPVRKSRDDLYNHDVKRRLYYAVGRASPVQADIRERLGLDAKQAQARAAYEARISREAPALLAEVAALLRRRSSLPAGWQDQREAMAVLAKIDALLPVDGAAPTG